MPCEHVGRGEPGSEITQEITQVPEPDPKNVREREILKKALGSGKQHPVVELFLICNIGVLK